MAGMPPPPPRASSPSREHPGASSSPSSSSSFAPRPTDAAVRLTNDEASVAKARCHELGYFDDPLAAAFAPRGPAKRGGGGTHHEPLINRGYYARVRAMRAMIDAFMDASLPGDDDDDDDRDVRDDGGGETASHTTPFAWCTPFLEDFSRRHSSPALPFQRLTGKMFD